MTNWFAQIAALIEFNLRTLPRRKGSALTAMVGIAGVVAVLVGVLSIGQGFSRVMESTGAPDSAIVMRSGADSEMMSILMRNDVNIIGEAPGIARANNHALVSPELFVIVDLPKRSTNSDANVPFRGVEQTALAVHPEVHIVQGRMFEWGKNEVIIGRGAHNEFSGLDVGREVRFGQTFWKIVGMFEAGGGLPESELWGDAAVLAPAYHRGESFQVVKVKLASPGSFQQFKDALTADPRISVKVQRETEYYAAQSRMIVLMVTGLGSIISLLMAIGAIFGALNTMYTAVSARAREIATLEALGFGTSPVVLSVLVESMLLALVGGLAGAFLAWAIFDGYRAATLNWQTFSQVTFAFDVNARLLTTGVGYALLIGFIGGLLPAIRAARLPLATALRAG
ncbi:MAG TPA: ABC transporter permease [Thermoanaerobaculia bacterium]|nr:ABC transporter permease [Thermoanaerobaculia bacterium]